MTPEKVKEHFEASGALLSGHFKLSSGLHSDRYMQCAKVLQWPDRAEALGAALAASLRVFGAQVVVSPAMGGLIIGHELGRGLSVRAIFAERVEGMFAFRRGFGLSPGEKAAVIEDVVTTGKSTREVLDLVRSSGAEPVACAAIVDRRDAIAEVGSLDGVPFRALWALQIATWDPVACPLCRVGTTVEAPGSRFLPKG